MVVGENKMKKSTVIFYALCVVLLAFFVKALFTPALEVRDLKYVVKAETISKGVYRLENIQAGCRGIETFQQMATDNPSIRIYDKYKKEMSITLNYTRKNLEYFGLKNHLLDCKSII
jgi:hypothetical protein